CTPIGNKLIATHGHLPGVHHGHTAPIAPECVAAIVRRISVHEVQAVAYVPLADIVGDHRATGGFQVDPVAVPAKAVPDDCQVAGAPGMNRVATHRLAGRPARYIVAENRATVNVRQ